MSLLRDMYYGMKNRSLKTGTRFAVDSFQCTESALGKVTFKWEHPDGENAVYELEMLTDLHIPKITRNTWDLSMSGCLNYDETQRDNVTGKEVTVYYKVKAAEWWLKAADQGNMYAQHNLGNLLFDGNGVTQNKTEAVKWWAKSAEQGYDAAQKDLGYAYHFGEGIKQDYAKAKEWYLKAIEGNNEIAFNNLGVLYRDGLGVKQDFAKAEEYFNKAIEEGCEKAKEHLAKLEQMKGK